MLSWLLVISTAVTHCELRSERMLSAALGHPGNLTGQLQAQYKNIWAAVGSSNAIRRGLHRTWSVSRPSFSQEHKTVDVYQYTCSRQSDPQLHVGLRCGISGLEMTSSNLCFSSSILNDTTTITRQRYKHACNPFKMAPSRSSVKDSSYDDIRANRRHAEDAGQTLLATCSNIRPSGKMTRLEEQTIDDCFAACMKSDSVVFSRYFVESLKVLLNREHQETAMAMLEKIPRTTLTQLLQNEPAILPSIIRARRVAFWECLYWEFDETTHNITRLLLSNGANINGCDHEGHTATFFACILRDYGLFRICLEAGADLSIRHNFEFWKEGRDLNLLQLTIEVILATKNDRYWPKIYDYPWRLDLGTRWGKIASELQDAGLSCPADDPRMVRLLHVACYQGHLKWVLRLVNRGIPIDMSSRQDRDDGKAHPSALHAAASRGQQDMVKFLLGFDTCSPHKHSAFKVAMDEVRTIIKREEREDLRLVQRVLNHLASCIMLVEAGADAECSEHTALLELCARYGDEKLVKRLLDLGITFRHVPDTLDMNIIQLLISHGSDFDASRAQKLAIESRDQEFLCSLVETWGGPHCTSRFGTNCEDASSQRLLGHVQIFRFDVLSGH